MPASEAPAGLSLGEALRWGAERLALSDTAQLDSRVLLKVALGLDDALLIVEGARRLAGAEAARFAAMIARRAAGEPIAYITGVREFWSLEIAVEPGVLVPRADSETLIAAVVARREKSQALTILDLGCGSGALLCALLTEFPAAAGVGVDIDMHAVALTERNLRRLGLAARARALAGDWTAPLDGRFDVVISNPPYVAESERGRLPHEVEAFEDPRALFAGPDGLDAFRQLAGLLPAVVAPAGLVVLEIGHDQGASAETLLAPAFPGGRTNLAPDLAGRDRALIIDLRPPAR